MEEELRERKSVPTSIAICLSGGGLRATFFHLGTIRALRRLNLLDKTKFIFSVSGGSILAGHLALNWSRYCTDGKDAAEAEAELISFGRRDLRGRVLRRWMLTWWTLFIPKRWTSLRFGPMRYLEREYHRLFKGGTFSEASQGGSPDLYILSTNLNNGALCSFSKQGYYLEDEDDAFFAHEGVPLSLAVTASSAFPPLFPPVEIERTMFSVELERFRFSPHLLTDGGVFDNLGYEKAKMLEGRGELQADLIIISDAGGPFDWKIDSDFFWPVSRSIRTADILMNRISESTLRRLKAEQATIDTVVCSIEDNTLGGSPIHIQNQLRYIRTDLDAFNATEIDQLAQHGEAVGIEKISDHFGGVFGVVSTKNEESRKAAVSLKKTLDRSPFRRWGLFNWRDAASYLVVSLYILLPLFLGYFFVIQPQFTIERNNAKLESTNVKAIELKNDIATLSTRNLELSSSLNVALQAIEIQAQEAPTACRDPSHGVERYQIDNVIKRTSDWMQGGHSRTEWCDTVISSLRPDYSADALLEIADTSEETRSTCRPFNCVQYRYTCSVRVRAGPIYNEKASAACLLPDANR
ncbi:patatin-like phospholipase family protein [Rhizobium laguerreae]|uniref:patatin-like phospholipase family protein n=1 Tax=Rhizobium laguerreae TaxID=1076926 RepID=UPI001C9231C6|nr:patatin-like phospholipase family protein [Rhizobium laguerreae]MBY3544795.1 patatin-like phospholipase family protein [Rhizobium laguerreae]MBY3549252.1 patatin-like phospholipase family protein [Rhizobium laguerreae]